MGGNPLNQNLSIVWLKFTKVRFGSNATGTPRYAFKAAHLKLMSSFISTPVIGKPVCCSKYKNIGLGFASRKM